jgi:hypothetical protein
LKGEFGLKQNLICPLILQPHSGGPAEHVHEAGIR